MGSRPEPSKRSVVNAFCILAAIVGVLFVLGGMIVAIGAAITGAPPSGAYLAVGFGVVCVVAGLAAYRDPS